MSKEKKSTDMVVKYRVLELVPLVTTMSRQQILQYVANEHKDWDLKDRQVDNYIAKAKKIVKEQFKKHKEIAAASSLTNYQDLYRKSYSKEDYRTCNSIQENIDSLFGLKKFDPVAEINNDKVNVVVATKDSDRFSEIMEQMVNGN